MQDFTLEELRQPYALSLAPGFFRFYAHMGIIHSFQVMGLLNPSHISGSSAGALVGGFLAAGMTPDQMCTPVFKIRREDMWDMGGYVCFGLLKGQLFHEILLKNLPVDSFERCPIPLGVTAFDVYRLRTSCITTGDLATAVRASCTFPGLFQPVIIDSRPHIDGGVFDNSGMMAIPGVPTSNLIVNVVFGQKMLSYSHRELPRDRFPNVRLLTIVVENIPDVSPFSMTDGGPLAYSMAKRAMTRACKKVGIKYWKVNHWTLTVDGAFVDPMREPNVTVTYDEIEDDEHGGEVFSTLSISRSMTDEVIAAKRANSSLEAKKNLSQTGTVTNKGKNGTKSGRNIAGSQGKFDEREITSNHTSSIDYDTALASTSSSSLGDNHINDSVSYDPPSSKDIVIGVDVVEISNDKGHSIRKRASSARTPKRKAAETGVEAERSVIVEDGAEGLGKMTIAQLKGLLTKRKIDFRDSVNGKKHKKEYYIELLKLT